MDSVDFELGLGALRENRYHRPGPLDGPTHHQRHVRTNAMWFRRTCDLCGTYGPIPGAEQDCYDCWEKLSFKDELDIVRFYELREELIKQYTQE